MSRSITNFSVITKEYTKLRQCLNTNSYSYRMVITSKTKCFLFFLFQTVLRHTNMKQRTFIHFLQIYKILQRHTDSVIIFGRRTHQINNTNS